MEANKKLPLVYGTQCSILSIHIRSMVIDKFVAHFTVMQLWKPTFTVSHAASVTPTRLSMHVYSFAIYFEHSFHSPKIPAELIFYSFFQLQPQYFLKIFNTFLFIFPHAIPWLFLLPDLSLAGYSFLAWAISYFLLWRPFCDFSSEIFERTSISWMETTPCEIIPTDRPFSLRHLKTTANCWSKFGG